MSGREREQDGRLTRFSLDRRITVFVLLLTSVVVGGVAATRIPVELIPSGFSEPFLAVQVPWPDAPSKEVLDKVTIVLEEELSTVRGFDDITTISTTNQSMAQMTFKHGTDMNIAYREVRDRVERARTRFPDDIDRVFIRKDDASGIPVYVLGVAVDPSIHDSYNLIQNEIVRPLSRVDGVASVSVQGLLEKEILIELDRKKTSAAGLNIYQLAQQLSSDNFTLASGSVRDGSRKLMLRSVARYSSLEQLQNRMVSPSVRLKDVARISYEEPEKEYRARAMSRPAHLVLVFKEGEANVRRVSNDVDEIVQTLYANPRLASLEMINFFSQGETIDEALATLLSSGMVGGIIAGLTLFFFMRRFRLTLIIALCIPLSLMIGLTFMYFAGETLNILSLLGLMICVGLLVDNSVVVAENIHRLHREGIERRRACIQGAGEVGLAITMSTLTTIVVFLPVSLVDGPGQFLLLRLAMPVCISVAASLMIALVCVPLAVYLTLPRATAAEDTSLTRRVHEKMNGVLRRGYDLTFGRLNNSYSSMLDLFLRRRFDLVLLLIALGGLTAVVPGKQVSVVEIDDEERGGFFIGVTLPDNMTMEESEDYFKSAEQTIEPMKERLGLEGWFIFHTRTFGNVQGWFARPRQSDVSVSEATKIVLDALPKKPGIKLTTGRNNNSTDDDGKALYRVSLNGENTDQLEQVAGRLEDVLDGVDGVLGLKQRNETPPNELGLIIDRDRSQRYGVNPQVVAGVVAYALRGSPLPKYREAGKEIPVRVRFRQQDRESLTELADFLVPTNLGELLPLGSVTDAKFLPTPETIVRRNKRTGRSITLELEEGREKETRARLDQIVAGIDLPEGISLGANAQRDTFKEDVDELKFALVLSTVFIYLLMGFLFESFILPLSIILTIPLSSLGVFWMHWIVGRDIDLLGIVAVVLLVGVVVNNGIVLIDYVNRLRARGSSRHDALVTATHRRFQPIMMTAITTIGGMIPLALSGANSIGLSYTSFALTLIGGMTTATLLTLLVVPVFYTFFDDSREALSGVFYRVVGRRGKARAAQPAVS